MGADSICRASKIQ